MRSLVAAILALSVIPAAAQSLGEAARKERERRAQAQPAPQYTNADVVKAAADRPADPQGAQAQPPVQDPAVPLPATEPVLLPVEGEEPPATPATDRNALALRKLDLARALDAVLRGELEIVAAIPAAQELLAGISDAPSQVVVLQGEIARLDGLLHPAAGAEANP